MREIIFLELRAYFRHKLHDPAIARGALPLSSTPSLQQRIADLDLRRRMAWGLIGGKSKAAIAEAEGLTLAECQAILEQPGTYVLFNVWSLFLWHQQRGG